MNPETQTEEVRRMRLAIVAPSDSAFGVSRIFQGFREEERTLRIFRSRLEAVQWLTGVPEGQAY